MSTLRHNSFFLLAVMLLLPIHSIAQEQADTRTPDYYTTTAQTAYKAKDGLEKGWLTVTGITTAQGSETKLKKVSAEFQLTPTLLAFDPVHMVYKKLEKPTRDAQKTITAGTALVSGVKFVKKEQKLHGAVSVRVPVILKSDGSHKVASFCDVRADITLVDSNGNDVFESLLPKNPTSMVMFEACLFQLKTLPSRNSQYDEMNRSYIVNGSRTDLFNYFKSSSSPGLKDVKKAKSLHISIDTDDDRVVQIAEIDINAFISLYEAIDELVETNLQTFRDNNGVPRY